MVGEIREFRQIVYVGVLLRDLFDHLTFEMKFGVDFVMFGY